MRKSGSTAVFERQNQQKNQLFVHDAEPSKTSKQNGQVGEFQNDSSRTFDKTILEDLEDLEAWQGQNLT